MFANSFNWKSLKFVIWERVNKHLSHAVTLIFQCDIFEMNAVDLGKLTKVKVSQDGAGFGSGWLLDKIVIKETEQSQTKYVFICGK